MIWGAPAARRPVLTRPLPQASAIHRFGSCAPRLSCTSWSRISRVRGGRRRLDDRGRDGAKQSNLVTIAARPRLVHRLASFAATTIWTLVPFLGCVAVLYGFTATQASWGGPPWWPVAAGAAVLCAFCALGFGRGVLLPGRFTAPLGGACDIPGAHSLLSGSSSTSRTPPFRAPLTDELWCERGRAGACASTTFLCTFFIVQIHVLVGRIAVAGLAVSDLQRRSGSRTRVRTAVVVTALGLGGSCTGVGLAGTARMEANGVVILPVHDAASDRPNPLHARRQMQ